MNFLILYLDEKGFSTILYIYIYIYIYEGWRESGFNCWGVRTRARVILVLRECIWNVPAVSLVLPAFDDTDSLGFPSRWVVYLPGSALGDCLPFP